MSAQRTDGNGLIHGFRKVSEEDLTELRSTASLYIHEKSGARLLHLHTEDPNNLFSIAFRTPVSDSTGVPHILEHSVLGGSRKFPVKDPFQLMLKGSLQTFLNALTYPDKTVYPVASAVERDFYNLVDVYCDAVFNPLLTEQTFQQEGWHFDVEQENGPVGIKGIVYNEMKGVFSDFRSHVIRKTIGALFPDTSYAFESGGEPEHITDLTYERFTAFHARYYHPSNSYIFLYGNRATEKTLAFLDDNYLNGFDRIEVHSQIATQPAWQKPRSVRIEAPAPAQDDGTATVILNWIFGESCDPQSVIVGSVLSHYLLGAESSPLRRALIDSRLGEDLDDMCGFDADLAQSTFTAGLRKTRPEHAGKIEAVVRDTLRLQAEGGMDMRLLEGCLRQAEFSLREVSDAGRFPYCLKLAERCYRSWIYCEDPMRGLKLMEPLAALNRRLAGGDNPFALAVRQRLLDNPHCLVSIITASHAMSRAMERQTREQIEKLTGGFTAADVRRYHTLTGKLLAEQKAEPDPAALASVPRLSKADLPRQNRTVTVETSRNGAVTLHAAPLFTAGIAYCDIGFDCGTVPAALVPYLPLYAEIATRCGAAGFSYEEMATRISLASGGIGADVSIHRHAAEGTPPVFRYFIRGKALEDRFGEMLGIINDLFHAPKLDDPKLVTDLLLEMRNDMSASVVGQGHSYAASRAAGRLDGVQQVAEVLDGVTQLRFLDGLVKKADAGAVIGNLLQLHRVLLNRREAVVAVTAEDPSAPARQCLELLDTLGCGAASAAPVFAPAANDVPTGVEISSSVNFVARAWRLPLQDAAGIGLCGLLSTNLSRGFLWDKVRVEGGAYGSSASIGSTYPVYVCTSYRDPNIRRTLDMFQNGLRHTAERIDAAAIDESIIGTIGQIDRPHTPYNEAMSEVTAVMRGKTRSYRQQVRDAILNATPRQVRQKAEEIMGAADTATVVLGGAAAFDEAAKQGLNLAREPLLGSNG